MGRGEGRELLLPPPTPRSVKVRAVRALLYLFTDLPEQLLRKHHAKTVSGFYQQRSSSSPKENPARHQTEATPRGWDFTPTLLAQVCSNDSQLGRCFSKGFFVLFFSSTGLWLCSVPRTSSPNDRGMLISVKVKGGCGERARPSPVQLSGERCFTQAQHKRSSAGLLPLPEGLLYNL